MVAPVASAIAQEPVSALGAVTAFDSGERYWRREIDNTTMALTARNSLCQFSKSGFDERPVSHGVRVLDWGSSAVACASDWRFRSRATFTFSYRRARGAVQLVIGMVAS